MPLDAEMNSGVPYEYTPPRTHVQVLQTIAVLSALALCLSFLARDSMPGKIALYPALIFLGVSMLLFGLHRAHNLFHGKLTAKQQARVDRYEISILLYSLLPAIFLGLGPVFESLRESIENETVSTIQGFRLAVVMVSALCLILALNDYAGFLVPTFRMHRLKS